MEQKYDSLWVQLHQRFPSADVFFQIRKPTVKEMQAMLKGHPNLSLDESWDLVGQQQEARRKRIKTGLIGSALALAAYGAYKLGFWDPIGNGLSNQSGPVDVPAEVSPSNDNGFSYRDLFATRIPPLPTRTPTPQVTSTRLPTSTATATATSSPTPTIPATGTPQPTQTPEATATREVGVQEEQFNLYAPPENMVPCAESPLLNINPALFSQLPDIWREQQTEGNTAILPEGVHLFPKGTYYIVVRPYTENTVVETTGPCFGGDPSNPFIVIGADPSKPTHVGITSDGTSNANPSASFTTLIQ